MNGRQRHFPPTSTSGWVGFLVGLVLAFFVAWQLRGAMGSSIVPFAPTADTDLSRRTPSGFDRNSPEALIVDGRLPPKGKLIRRLAKCPDLSKSDLDFGALQVLRMVHDRPNMGHGVGKRDPVWQYCARAFAGAAAGKRIYWNPGEPGGTADAEHQAPDPGVRGFIRVSMSRDNYNPANARACESLWSRAVYELENIRSWESASASWDLALKGELKREQWIRFATESEYQAIRRQAQLFDRIWKPMAKARGLTADPGLWRTDLEPT
jgi:hypothetical protein